MEVKVVFDDIPRIISELDGVMEVIVKKTTYDCEAAAKRRAPVDTGALRSSIQSRFPTKLTGEVTVGVNYAIYVEYGTYKMRAQPFLAPALREVESAFQRAVGAALERLAKRG